MWRCERQGSLSFLLPFKNEIKGGRGRAKEGLRQQEATGNKLSDEEAWWEERRSLGEAGTQRKTGPTVWRGDSEAGIYLSWEGLSLLDVLKCHRVGPLCPNFGLTQRKWS